MTEQNNDNEPGPEFAKVGEIHPEQIVPQAFNEFLDSSLIKMPMAFIPESQREGVKLLLKTTFEAGFGIGALSVMKEINRLSEQAKAEMERQGKNSAAPVIFCGPPGNA